MTFVIGRSRGPPETTPAGRLGTFRALDGSEGAPLHLDVNRPHAIAIVGKRGYGKSYTLGVIAEELAREPTVAPVIIDPMGTFAPLAGTDTAGVAATVIDEPTVRPGALDPRSWCTLVGLSPDSGPGALVWGAAQDGSTLAAMRERIRGADAPGSDRRAARNHVALAESWGIFDADAGLDAAALSGSEITVLDVSGMDTAPLNAVARGVAESLYHARVADTTERLPWLLLDEAHTVFDGVAEPALTTLLTRGRAPGVSTVLATQRPSALPAVGVSQSDILISHRLTSQADIDALRAAQPTYMTDSLDERMPTAPGDVVLVDDATETVHTATIRERDTEHGGESAKASDVSLA